MRPRHPVHTSTRDPPALISRSQVNAFLQWLDESPEGEEDEGEGEETVRISQEEYNRAISHAAALTAEVRAVEAKAAAQLARKQEQNAHAMKKVLKAFTIAAEQKEKVEEQIKNEREQMNKEREQREDRLKTEVMLAEAKASGARAVEEATEAARAEGAESIKQAIRVAVLQERRAVAATRVSEAAAALEKAQHDHGEAQAELRALEAELQQTQHEPRHGLSPASASSAAPDSSDLKHVGLEMLQISDEPAAAGNDVADNSDASSMSQLQMLTAGSFKPGSAEAQSVTKMVKTTSMTFNNLFQRLSKLFPASDANLSTFKRLEEMKPHLPSKLSADLHKMRRWRNAAEHGVMDGGISQPWYQKPQGGGEKKAPPLPSREEVKTTVAAAEAGVKKIEQERHEKINS